VEVKAGVVGNKERVTVTQVARPQCFANEFRRLHGPAAAAATEAARCSGAKLFAAVMAIGKNRPYCDRERKRHVGTVDVDMRSCRGKPECRLFRTGVRSGGALSSAKEFSESQMYDPA
jgi:hypothetical protein